VKKDELKREMEKQLAEAIKGDNKQERERERERESI
jgi:hypothetical protein